MKRVAICDNDTATGDILYNKVFVAKTFNLL